LRGVLASGRTTALIASHDAGLAVTLAGRSIRLEHGRRIDQRVARDPVRYVVRVTGLTAAQQHALGIAPGAETGASQELRVDDLGDGHALAAAIAAVVSGGGEVLQVESVRAGLVR
jgi:hypothetical protein